VTHFAFSKYRSMEHLDFFFNGMQQCDFAVLCPKYSSEQSSD